jgi:hypothetical protein
MLMKEPPAVTADLPPPDTISEPVETTDTQDGPAGPEQDEGDQK